MKNSLLTVGVAATLIGVIGHPLIHVVWSISMLMPGGTPA